MIAKYRPVYGAADLIGAMLSRCGASDRMRTRLRALYGCRHVFLFNSASSALWALLRAMGTHGALAIPAYTCIAVPNAVEWAGWRPVLVDIASDDVNMTAETLTSALSEDVSAVLITHQFGVPARMKTLLDLCRERRLPVIEDAAPAIGARYEGQIVGTFGLAAILSFNLTKVINAGHGGALLTNDDKIAAQVGRLTRPGGRDFYDWVRVGAWWAVTRPRVYGALRSVRAMIKREAMHERVAPNYDRPADIGGVCSDFVAALADRQFNNLEANVAARKRIAAQYAAALRDVREIRGVITPENCEPSWIQYPVFVGDRNAWYRFLLQKGVDANWTFRYSCAESYGRTTCPNAARAARTLLGLPTYPGLHDDEVVRVCHLMREYAARSDGSSNSNYGAAAGT